MSWSDDDIRHVALDRAKHLQKVRYSYQEALEAALREMADAQDKFVEAKNAVAELRRRLAPLPEEIAHLEACARSDKVTLEMLVYRGSKDKEPPP